MSESPYEWQWLDKPWWKLLADFVLSAFEWLLGL